MLLATDIESIVLNDQYLIFKEKIIAIGDNEGGYFTNSIYILRIEH